MKKRLLLQLLVVLYAVGSFAANAGDYLFSASAKYKLVDGVNLFENGDFSAGYNKWTNELGGDVADNWSLVTNDRPNATGMALQSQGSKTDEGTLLKYVLQMNPGIYTFSYWVKADGALSTSITDTGTNSVRFYTSTTGETGADSTMIAGVTSYSSEWKQVVFEVNISEEQPYFVFLAKAIATNVTFAGFELYSVEKVFDTRIAERLIDYGEKLLKEEDFKDLEGDGSLQGTIDFLKQMLVEPTVADDANNWEGSGAFLDMLNQVIEGFLNVNAGNTVSITVNGQSYVRYLTDWATCGNYNWNQFSKHGTWSFTGGRWGFSKNVDYELDDEGNVKATPNLERPFSDGYVASAGIQRGSDYNINSGVQIVDSTFNGTSLKPGKYMFSIEAQAVASQYSSNSDVAAHGYGSNDGVEIRGPWMWVGKDTVVFEDVVLNNTNWQRLYLIKEIKEGEDIVAGFHFPVLSDGSGGRYSVRNPEFRIVGKTQEEVDHLYAFDMISNHQTALLGHLTAANDENLKTKEDGYPWGHKVLSDSISKYQQIYDESVGIISADGIELQPAKVTTEYKDNMKMAVNAMSNARKNYSNTNKVYQTLVSDLASCKATYDDDIYKASNHAPFLEAISKAEKMIADTQTDADEVDAFNAMDDELLTARQDFMMVIGSRSTPIDLTYTIRNGGFEMWGTSEPRYMHPDFNGSSNHYEVNYWILDLEGSGKQWQVDNDEAYESGKKMDMWRGTAAGPNGKAHQEFNLWKAGVYEYRAKAYATDDTWAQYEGIASIMQNVNEDFDSETANDTIFNPNIRLFFGPIGSTTDSLKLYKCAPEIPNYSRYTPLTYSVFFIKKDDNPNKFELGLEAYQNDASKGANAFGFGDNHLFYLGDEAAYKAAIEADWVTEQAKARDIIAKYKDAELKYGNEAQRQGFLNAMYRYMGDRTNHALKGKKDLEKYVNVPTTIQDIQNAIHGLRENSAMLEIICTYGDEPTGISSPNVAKMNNVAKQGVYNLQGVKMNGKNLKKGLYIINGKKLVVK